MTQEYQQAIICPRCGYPNPADAINCGNCRINLAWALEHRDEITVEAAPPSPAYHHSQQDQYPFQSSFQQHTATPASGQRLLSIATLGLRVFGRLELLEGHGDKADQVVQAFYEQLAIRQLPGVQVSPVTLRTRNVLEQRREYHREYHLVSSPLGISIAVYIGSFGRDLYVSWHLFVNPVPNWIAMLGVFLISCVFTLPAFIVDTLEVWISTFVMLFIIAISVLGTGWLFTGNPIAAFFKQPTFFDLEDIAATVLAVHHSLLKALETCDIPTTTLPKELDLSPEKLRW